MDDDRFRKIGQSTVTPRKHPSFAVVIISNESTWAIEMFLTFKNGISSSAFNLFSIQSDDFR